MAYEHLDDFELKMVALAAAQKAFEAAQYRLKSITQEIERRKQRDAKTNPKTAR